MIDRTLVAVLLNFHIVCYRMHELYLKIYLSNPFRPGKTSSQQVNSSVSLSTRLWGSAIIAKNMRLNIQYMFSVCGILAYIYSS